MAASPEIHPLHSVWPAQPAKRPPARTPPKPPHAEEDPPQGTEDPQDSHEGGRQHVDEYA